MSHSELSRLFEAARAVRPGEGAAERGLARLLSEVAVQAAPAPVAAAVSKLAWTGIAKWILTGVVVGVAGSGAVAYTLGRPATPAPAREAAAIVASTAASNAAPLPEVAPPPMPDGPSMASAVAPRAGVAAAPQPVESAEASSFDAELRLIRRAKVELDEHRPAQAATWLAEHAQRFPNGVFAPDREALQVLASCSQRPDAARALRFAAQHPSSPMNERLLRDCGSPRTSKSSNETPGAGEPTHE